MTNKTYWVVLKGNKLRCLRCGAEAPAPVPALVKDFCDMVFAFEKNHRKCKVKP